MPAVALDKRDRERLHSIVDELSVVRIDKKPDFTSVLEELRALVELESVGLYSVRNLTGRWEVERWEAVGGPMSTSMSRMTKLFAEAREFPLYYNPLAPARAQRNRVVDALAWIETHQPGTWESHPMYTDVLRPLGAHRFHQPRALLCKGPALLGWFGGLDPKPPTARQLHILSKLVKPMCERLDVEARLSEKRYARPALDTLLERVGAPAFIVDERGVIQEANLAGRASLAMQQRDLSESVRRVALQGHGDDTLELIPVRDGDFCAWVAVIKTSSPDVRIARCLETCAIRWSLTPRQTEVLGHVVRGTTNATIAMFLGCVERTVELHITAIFDRAGLDSRSALIAAVLTSVA